jgi:hypothetical protein
LENWRVERFQASVDGKTLWMLVRRKGSELVQLAIWREGNRKTEFPNAFHADEILDFQRSPNEQWLAVLAKEGGKTFLKVFDGKGKDVAFPARTPLGEILAIQWTHENRLLVFAERFGELTLAIWSHGDTFRFVSMDAKTQPSQTAVGEGKIFVLTGATLKQGEIGQEFVTWRPIASSVSAFAVSGENVVVVKDEVLQLGTLKGQEFQLSVLDDRKGEFGDLTLSRDGQWLAYTYRAKTSDQPQLWLAHVPTKQLWRIAVNATSPVFAGR